MWLRGVVGRRSAGVGADPLRQLLEAVAEGDGPRVPNLAGALVETTRRSQVLGLPRRTACARRLSGTSSVLPTRV